MYTRRSALKRSTAIGVTLLPAAAMDVIKLWPRNTDGLQVAPPSVEVMVLAARPSATAL
ncbi:twin-arginine translocation signal domain-containing protein [Pseudomonas sp. 32A]|uniref:twin-arginine translocation signal domain-containing protein n=1 Tax=Pseudomonas sp. 32A TaxID=651185 RepID=UPI0040454A8D